MAAERVADQVVILDRGRLGEPQIQIFPERTHPSLIGARTG
jgi:hypothetical protein